MTENNLRLLLTIQQKHILFWGGLSMAFLIVLIISVFCYYRLQIRSKTLGDKHYDEKYLEAESAVYEH
jgi:hypothetical protein